MKFPMCSTMDQMREIRKRFTALLSQDGAPPCSEVQGMQVKYNEYHPDDVEEKGWYDNLKTDFSAINGWFQVRVDFRRNTFKEIKQKRAYTPQSLIGNAGGYVGLFVGYTVAELPILLGIVYKWFTSIFPGQNNSDGSPSSNVEAVSINVRRKENNQDSKNNVDKYHDLEAKLNTLDQENQKQRKELDMLKVALTIRGKSTKL